MRWQGDAPLPSGSLIGFYKGERTSAAAMAVHSSSPPGARPIGGIDSTVPEEISRLVAFVDGCKDDADGLNAKITLVRSFIAAQKGRADLIDVMCWLHMAVAVGTALPLSPLHRMRGCWMDFGEALHASPLTPQATGQ